MNRSGLQFTCEEITPLLCFYVCDEIDEQERANVDQHLATCEGCRAHLAEAQEFNAEIALVPQSADQLDRSEILLSQCRSELAESLDDLTQPRVRDHALRFTWFRRWMIVHPAWSGAAFVVFGVLLGVQILPRFVGPEGAGNLDQAVNVRPESPLTDDQLSKMVVAGINLTPSADSGKQRVRLQLSAEEPVTLTGSLDDPDVRRVLTFVVRNGGRFNSGIRQDCLEVLKTRSQDKEVRSALLDAARKDPNPAVRLKALEALRDSSADPEVREALLDSLQHDANPGVRVEAVNLLVRSLEQAKLGRPEQLLEGEPNVRIPEHDVSIEADNKDSGESMAYMVQTLQHLQHQDPSRYVRLQSGVALRQIDERREH
jgi:hypothetical protein